MTSKHAYRHTYGRTFRWHCCNKCIHTQMDRLADLQSVFVQGPRDVVSAASTSLSLALGFARTINIAERSWIKSGLRGSIIDAVATFSRGVSHQRAG